jgi:hypothetical protein
MASLKHPPPSGHFNAAMESAAESLLALAGTLVPSTATVIWLN